MSLHTRWRIAPAALALSLLVASCGASPSEEADAQAPAEDSPINALFKDVAALGSTNAVDAARAQSDTTRKVEEAVASCMTKQGFDYTPVVPTTSSDTAEVQDTGMSEEEFSKQYGYGISTWDDTPQGKAYEAEDSSNQTDANATAYEQMSESEKAAWDKALWGEMPTFGNDDAAGDDSAGDEFAQTASSGCYAQATQEVESGDTTTSGLTAVFTSPQFAELLTQLNAVYTDLDKDTAILDLNQSWQDCMAKAGYSSYRNPDEAYSGVANAYSGLWGDGEGETEPTAEAIAAIKKQEIETATTDYTCRVEVDYAGGRQRAQNAAEQKFVDAHRSELDQLVAALQEVGQ